MNLSFGALMFSHTNRCTNRKFSRKRCPLLSQKRGRFLLLLCLSLSMFSCPGCRRDKASRPPLPEAPSVLTPTLSPSQDSSSPVHSLLHAGSFSDFSTLLFRELAASDSLSLHYTILHPENLQIECPPVSFGSYSGTALKESTEQTELLLTGLHSFSRDSLSEADRFLFDLLDHSLQTALLQKGLELYLSPLGPATGLQVQLPVLLAEYRFSSLSDVENYFSLLADLPRFFSELASFEQERADAGFTPCEQVLTRICSQCDAFLAHPEQNLLISGFRDRLASLPELSATQLAELCIRNQKLVFTCVLPAYETLRDTLAGLSDSSVPPKGLCSFPNGSICYEALVRQKTGSDRSLDELEEMLSSCLYSSLLTMVTLSRDAGLQTELDQFLEYGFTRTTDAPTVSECSLLLDSLREKMKSDFPVSAKTTCRISLIHPSLAEYISPALYLIPPIDGYTENVIYLNPEKCERNALFSTLAHEGYPGHLYQNTYFAAKQEHPLRTLLNYTGYAEGWATYAEVFSYRYADCSEELRTFLAAEQLAGLCLYSLSDIRIHYRGEEKDTVLRFLKDYGLSSESAIEVYYNQLAEPGIYLPYSVGYLEFMELQKKYLEQAGPDASLLPFHTFLMETGPAPFALLKQKLDEYCNRLSFHFAP